MTITVTTHYVPPNDSSSPALAFQITSMVNSYMIWGGITQGGPEDVETAAANGRLAQDWACAMPPSKNGIPGPGTSLFRSSGTDVSLAMAQRLARKFKKQIFLSIDLPPAFTSMGEGSRLALELEKNALQILRKLEENSTA
ncbi:hypothetical protein M422DRAFT_205182 [Sphaerobolus stellatus SS14]|nr:hypothetical protein M422DRAFT_205182 [Sphaerobolus stellatus SS14]